jgi:formate hydrogenlyase subunit 6/NADH:ubiquinone oxidoreductase subunit I
MARPIWFVNLVKKYFPSRFSLAKLTKVPVVGRMIDYGLFEGDDIIYLPKDDVIQINEPIGGPEEVVLPSQLVDHFIGEANYHWVMNFCICRDASRCRSYPTDLGCLFLGEAVLDINPELGRLVTREEALAHVRRCREAGLVHLIGRNKLDSVWLGAHPGHKLFTICNCCPCCCLWRMLPDIDPSIGCKIHKMPSVTVTVTEECIGCGLCAEGVCFVDAIRMDGERAVISANCRGCGRCTETCPVDAIELSLDEELFMRQSIERLSSLVELT